MLSTIMAKRAIVIVAPLSMMLYAAFNLSGVGNPLCCFNLPPISLDVDCIFKRIVPVAQVVLLLMVLTLGRRRMCDDEPDDAGQRCTTTYGDV